MRLIQLQDIFDSPTAPQANLGERAETPDGRVFRYVQHNVAFTTGQLGVSVANTAVTNIVSTQNNNLGQTVFITETGAAWTVGQFQNAWGIVSGGTGPGQHFKIKDNTVDQLELYPDYRIRTALDTTSDLVLIRQNLARLSVGDALIGQILGTFPDFAASVANDYAWMLVEGIGAVVSDATGGLADTILSPSNATAGAVERVAAEETIDDASIVGRFLSGNVSEVGLAVLHVV